jgi:hypothetical protein
VTFYELGFTVFNYFCRNSRLKNSIQMKMMTILIS